MNPTDLPEEVVVTSHALDQTWARCDERRTLGAIKADVRAAVAEGRTRRTRPRWLDPFTFPPRGDGFFCWPLDMDRAYVCELARDGRAVVVKTCLTPDFSALGIGEAGAGS